MPSKVSKWDLLKSKQVHSNPFLIYLNDLRLNHPKTFRNLSRLLKANKPLEGSPPFFKEWYIQCIGLYSNLANFKGIKPRHYKTINKLNDE